MPGINDSKCVLVIGATAGIGRALALAIHALPSKPTVIVAGRRKERLDELVKKGDGRIEAMQVDISSGKDMLKAFADEVIQKFPDVSPDSGGIDYRADLTSYFSLLKLDAVLFAAGIQRAADFKEPEKIDLDALFEEVHVNYLAILALTKFLLPHFLRLSSEGRPTFIIPISSGLAMVPVTHVTSYCATKAAVHSLSMSLRISLSDTNVHIMEIMPPVISMGSDGLLTEQGTTEAISKNWMPLDEFTKYTMEGLQRGDFNIVVPSMKEIWNNVEAERVALSGRILFAKKGN
ncbi:hypothetical protein A7U60_g5854 [Sanghuangporus baumii]|uniref:NAD(P)-binding protein n=1 Tax=Sanghuangporus baumii TaxID=108892 RepID=A0A9Q5HWF2_SANBA|nr:hypothetical protein A7U60_g5854 [Sanghuangporus baumii]